MVAALLLELEALEPDSSIPYKTSSQHKAIKPDYSPYLETTQPISLPKYQVARPDFLLQQKVTKPDPLQ